MISLWICNKIRSDLQPSMILISANRPKAMGESHSLQKMKDHGSLSNKVERCPGRLPTRPPTEPHTHLLVRRRNIFPSFATTTNISEKHVDLSFFVSLADWLRVCALPILYQSLSSIGRMTVTSG